MGSGCRREKGGTALRDVEFVGAAPAMGPHMGVCMNSKGWVRDTGLYWIMRPC